MKSLIKFALGAAIAGALINLLLKHRARAMAEQDRAFDDSVGVGAESVEVVEDIGNVTDEHVARVSEPSIH